MSELDTIAMLIGYVILAAGAFGMAVTGLWLFWRGLKLVMGI